MERKEDEKQDENQTVWAKRALMAQRVGVQLGGDWFWAGDYTSSIQLINGVRTPDEVAEYNIQSQLLQEKIISHARFVTVGDSTDGREAIFYKKGQNFESTADIVQVREQVWYKINTLIQQQLPYDL
jgi:hypothetical protein